MDEYNNRNDYVREGGVGLECSKNNGESCICRILQKFAVGKEVMVRTNSGDAFEGEVVCVTKDGCLVLLEPEVMTPYIEKRVVFVRCDAIESVSVDADHPHDLPDSC
ncbi:hypothetical protein LCM20_07590 [Halobacillus litoralis]|uniref:hypothetical protein n=1 Tax=Halobacillus litoralis TaxID=45668 RepID=UPI001CD7E6C8|nr:hypothetical protein [Halobacillus litoralis]MCA0970444.1 hypothetical protein [Halobacillus litoralis]